MAHLSIDFYSKSVMRITNMKVIIPNDLLPVMREGNKAYERPMGLLILLHGFSGASMDWITGSRVQELAITYNLMVVMPSGDNSFYLNGKGADMAYEDLIAKEIPEYLRKTFCMDFGPENTYIGGLSMGGFGAIHTGLKYPEVFEKIFVGNIHGFSMDEVMSFVASLPEDDDELAKQVLAFANESNK